MDSEQREQTVPSSWPGAFGVYKHSKAIVMTNLWPVLGLTLLSVIASSALESHSKQNSFSPLAPLGWLLTIWFTLSLVYLFLAGARGEKVDAWESLKRGGAVYINGFLTVILVALISIVSFILFVIPAFFVIPRLVLALYYVVDKQMDPMESIKASWNETKGNVGKVYGLIGVNILFAILCLVLVGFYLLFIYQAVFAVLYLFVTSHQTAKVPADTTAAAE